LAITWASIEQSELGLLAKEAEANTPSFGKIQI
jgi:hypothetical protein